MFFLLFYTFHILHSNFLSKSHLKRTCTWRYYIPQWSQWYPVAWQVTNWKWLPGILFEEEMRSHVPSQLENILWLISNVCHGYGIRMWCLDCYILAILALNHCPSALPTTWSSMEGKGKEGNWKNPPKFRKCVCVVQTELEHMCLDFVAGFQSSQDKNSVFWKLICFYTWSYFILLFCLAF